MQGASCLLLHHCWNRLHSLFHRQVISSDARPYQGNSLKESITTQGWQCFSCPAMRWGARQVALLWIPDRLHVPLCHAAQPHHLRGDHWQHLPSLAGACSLFTLIWLYPPSGGMWWDDKLFALRHRHVSSIRDPPPPPLAKFPFSGWGPTWCTQLQQSCPSVSSLTFSSSTTPSLSNLIFSSFSNLILQRPGHLPGSSGGGYQRWDGPIWPHHTVSFHLPYIQLSIANQIPRLSICYPITL